VSGIPEQLKCGEKMDSEEIIEKLNDITYSLKGLGGLFTTSAKTIYMDGDEIYGVGKLIQSLGESLSSIAESLKNKK
jgi:hypothetical protein